MNKNWQTVRVFISSTFRDMHAERDHLVKVTFPKLRVRLEAHRIHLVDIDLRWGVTKDQADNDRALELCLQQIDTCRPFFIGIIGDRYGWVPGDLQKMDESRYGSIQALTGKSITELEVLHGVLRNPKMKQNACFYFRSSGFASELDDAHKAIFTEMPSDHDIGQFGFHAATRSVEDRKCKLEALKQEIRSWCSSAGAPLREYPCRWDATKPSPEDESVGRLVGLEQFGEWVEKDLWDAILREYPHIADPEQPPAVEGTPAWLKEEQIYHECFAESRLQVYVKRETLEQQLLEYVTGSTTTALLLSGGSGSGKSAVLSWLWRQLCEVRPDDKVFPHFVGATPSSTGLGPLLRRFCMVLRDIIEKPLSSNTTGVGTPNHIIVIPEDPNELPVVFISLLYRVPADQRIVLFVDAVNQLDEYSGGQKMRWLPEVLPPHVKIIVSCIDEEGRPQSALAKLRTRNIPEVKVGQLTEAERRNLVTIIPALSAKTLDPKQIDLLLANPATRNPLYLTVALEELRGFGSFERLNARITSFPPQDGEPGLTALFDQVISRLEQEIGEETVRSSLALIASSRMGLSETELTELLARLAPERSNDPVQMQVMLRQLRPYLLRRGSLVDFSHRNLWKAVTARYQKSAKPHDREPIATAPTDSMSDASGPSGAWHRFLADYFRAQGVTSLRMLSETPYHMVHGAQWEELERLLTDWRFLEAKTQRISIFNLTDDIALAVDALPTDRTKRPFLELLTEALRRDIHFIATHTDDYPQALFQCLWNACWWYDCANLINFSCSSAEETSKEQPSFKGPISMWMENWRHEKQAGGAFSWLRSLRPPSIPLGEGFRGVLQGHTGFVCNVAVSPDGLTLASGAADGSICVWDCASLRLLQRGHLFRSAVHGLAFDPLDPCRLACCTHNGTLAIVRISDSKITVDAVVSSSVDHIIERTFDKFGEICRTGETPNEKLVVLQDETLQCLQRVSRDIRHEQDHAEGSPEQSGLMWDAASGKMAHGSDVYSLYSLSWSACGRHLGAVRNGTPSIWEVRDEKGNTVSHVSHELSLLKSILPMLPLSIGASEGNERGHSKIGTKVATLKNLRVYTPASFVCARDGFWFAACNEGVRSLTIDPAAAIVRGSLMPNVEPCSSNAGCPYSAATSPDGRHVVTGGLEGKVQVWESDTFRLLWESDFRGTIQAVTWSTKTPGRYTGLGDGEIAVLVGDGNYMDALRLDPETGSELGRRPVPNHPLSPFFSYSFAANTMFAITAGGEIHAWSEQSAIIPQQSSLTNRWVSCLHFLPDGRLILHADVLENVTFVEACSGIISKTKLIKVPRLAGAKQGRQSVAQAALFKDENAAESAGTFCLAYGNGAAVVGTFLNEQFVPNRWMAENSPLLCVDSGKGFFVLGREDGRLLLWEHGVYKSMGDDSWLANMPKSPVRALSINPKTQEIAFGNDSGEVFLGSVNGGWWMRIYGKPIGPSMMTDPVSGIAVLDIQKMSAQEKRMTPVIAIRWQDSHTVLCQHADGTCWRLRISGSMPDVKTSAEPFHQEVLIAGLGSIPQTAADHVFVQQSAGSTLMNLKTGKPVAHWPVPFSDRIGAFIKASPTEKLWAASSGSQFYLFKLEDDTGAGTSAETVEQDVEIGLPQVDVATKDALARHQTRAHFLETQGDWAGAENIYREILDARQRLLGSDHPDTLGTMFSLASLLRRKGELEEAERLYRAVLETRKRIYPPDHPETLVSLNAVALMRKQRGDFGEAEILYERVLAAQTKTLGDDHDATLTTKANLGRLYEALRQYEKAESLLRDVVSARVRTLGDNHPETLMSMHNLSSVLECMNRNAEAEELERAAYEGMNRINPGSEDTLLCAHDLGFLLLKKHDPRAALPLCQKVLEGFTRIYGHNHPRTIQAHQELDAVKTKYGPSPQNLMGEAKAFIKKTFYRQ